MDTTVTPPTTTTLGTPSSTHWDADWLAEVDHVETELGHRICGAHTPAWTPLTHLDPPQRPLPIPRRRTRHRRARRQPRRMDSRPLLPPLATMRRPLPPLEPLPHGRQRRHRPHPARTPPLRLRKRRIRSPALHLFFRKRKGGAKRNHYEFNIQPVRIVHHVHCVHYVHRFPSPRLRVSRASSKKT